MKKARESCYETHISSFLTYEWEIDSFSFKPIIYIRGGSEHPPPYKKRLRGKTTFINQRLLNEFIYKTQKSDKPWKAE